MSQRDSDIGIVCVTHGFQAGRTRCRWCNFDPLKISRDCGEPASRQPHKLETDSSTLSIATNTSSGCNAGLPRAEIVGDRGAFIQSGQQCLPDVSGNVFHQKILPHSEVETG